jgi:hypothetical protein
MKMSILLKAIYRLNAMPNVVIHRMRKTNPKFIQKCKRSQRTKVTLSRRTMLQVSKYQTSNYTTET